MIFNRRQLLLYFYLATPLFFLMDSLFGWNIRISSLDAYPAWKASYYLLLLGLGFAMYKWPLIEPILGIIEGGVNMLLLTLSVLLPYYAAIDAISSGETIQNPLNNFSIINYLISGMFLFVSMRLHHSNAKN